MTVLRLYPIVTRIVPRRLKETAAGLRRSAGRTVSAFLPDSVFRRTTADDPHGNGSIPAFSAVRFLLPAISRGAARRIQAGSALPVERRMPGLPAARYSQTLCLDSLRYKSCARRILAGGQRLLSAHLTFPVEPDRFASFPDALCRAVGSPATAGYGDRACRQGADGNRSNGGEPAGNSSGAACGAPSPPGTGKDPISSDSSSFRFFA